jgi:hypothetical protein
MAFNTGAGTRLAIGKESAWGTPVADTMLVNYESESISPQVKKTEEPSLLAAKAAAAYDLMGIDVSGDFSAVLKPENAGFFFKAALGGTDTVTNPSATYCHTIPAAAASGALPSYTIIIDRKQAIKRYAGMKCASMRLSARAGDYCKVAMSWKGKDESTGTVTTSTVPSLKAYKFIGGTLSLGATSMEITGVELGIDNALDGAIQTNSSGTYFTEPVHGARKITLDVELPYDANTETIWTTNFLTETLLSTAVLHLESPSIITAALKYRLDATLSNVAVIGMSRSVNSSGIITATIKCEATAVGATEPISVAIYDATSAAY